jgi:hypothetical protein
MHNIIHGDILEWAKSYTGPKFHCLLADPPYHLTSITERFGKEGSAPAQFGKDGAFARVSKGFMASEWDGGSIAFEPATWAALAEHLYPGAFGMAFASTRGFHRMAVAIEDAGLIIHPTIFVWGFGSGFPKATRLDTTIDRRAGEKPTVIGKKKHQPKFAAKDFGYREKDNGFNSKDRETFDLTEPTTDLARAWAGHRYGLQALKPALEPIIVFQKPYEGDPVSNITSTGAGAWNIDAGRIGNDSTMRSNRADMGYHGGLLADEYSTGSANGRWPANLVLSHSPLCVQIGTKRVKSAKGQADYTPSKEQNTPVKMRATTIKTGAHHGDETGHETVADWECVEDCPVYRLGLQSGEQKSGVAVHRNGVNATWGTYGAFEKGANDSGYGDSGTAARYFFNADYALDRLEAADPLLYVPKASSTERDAGLHQFEPITVSDGREKPIDNAYQRGEISRRNPHPTVKPLTLVKHLASLLLPPEMYAPDRRILVPFAGVGSEMIGAMLAGWDEVVGIELEALHVDVARVRLDWWEEANRLAGTAEPDAILDRIDDTSSPEDLKVQFTLFDLLS